MLTDKLSPDSKPFDAPGLPTLYGGNGWWTTALPMPLTSTLWHSLVALPHPRRGHSDFAEPGEVPASFENDDGEGDAPAGVMLESARWLIDHDEAVERAIIATITTSLPKLLEIQAATVLDTTDRQLCESWDEPEIRAMVRLLNITLHEVKGRLPYFGVEFACSWDREHGYGIMFHGTDVVEWGGGNVPNLSWVAARHAQGRS